MKWNIKRSNEIKEKIATNEDLMRQLSEEVQEIFNEHNVKFEGMGYMFEPRVFTLEKSEVPELILRSKKAMAIAKIEFEEKDPRLLIPDFGGLLCLPYCGIVSPEWLKYIEQLRFFEHKFDDPVSMGEEIKTPMIPLPPPSSKYLMNRIVYDQKLLMDLGKKLFMVLEKNGIKFTDNEGCVFTPLVFEMPAFAQKVGTAKSFAEVKGFGPQIIDRPTRGQFRIPSLPGIIAIDRFGPTVGVIWDPDWWIGIPDPLLLVALDKYRAFEY